MTDWVVKPTFEVMKLEDEVVELTGRVRLTADMRYEVELVDGRVVDASLLATVSDSEIGE
jgi:hypothetical protein